MKILFLLEKTPNEINRRLAQLVKWSFADGHEVHYAYNGTFTNDLILQSIPITLHLIKNTADTKSTELNIEGSNLCNISDLQQKQLSNMQLINRLEPNLVVCNMLPSLCGEQRFVQVPLIKINTENIEHLMKKEKHDKTNAFTNVYDSIQQCFSSIKNKLTFKHLPKVKNINSSCKKSLEASHLSQEFIIEASNNNLQKDWLNLISLFVEKKNNKSDTRRLNISNKKSTGVSAALQQLYEEHLPNQKTSSKFYLSLATSTEDREAAYHLAYKIYREKSYVEENSSEILTTPFDLVDDTMILIVKHKSKVVGTLTLLYQKDMPLPIENVFKEEITQLNLAGEKIVEVSRLAIDPEYRNEKEVLKLLFNYVLICTYHVMHYTSLVIEVNPRHAKFYEMLLAFHKISDEKPCPHVQNAPAVLLQLPLSRYREKLQECEKIRNAEANTMKRERSLYSSFMSMNEEENAANDMREQFKELTKEQKEYFFLHMYELSSRERNWL